MAIYHFSGTVISRSQGRSAVACAAYRAADNLHDERYGKDHDYTHKQDVVYTEILLPENAPAQLSNRETLWNTVELFEKRKDAQLAREFNCALPRELTLEQNIELAREYVKEAFVNKGMIADLCIHNDKLSNGELHPHAHVMLTMREVTSDGFGKKAREWNDKALLLSWREEWAETTNKHLALHGHDRSIDHRSLADQHIALEPQYKIGAAVARDRLIRMEDHQRIARENGEKLLVDPSIALHAITRQQSTFTHHDLARFVNRHTVDADQFALVYEKIKLCQEMERLGVDDQGRERFTTKEMLAIESQIIEQASGLQDRDAHAVKSGCQEKALLQKQLTAEQQQAFLHIVGQGDLKCVVGYAGTGKSYLLGTAREAWESQGFNVLGVTLSGIAAETLEGSSGIASRTFASRSYYWDKGEEGLTRGDILVVDEAGMLSSRQMGKLIAEAHAGGAKVVLVGDTQQLQAIEAGAAFRAILGGAPSVALTDIRRQQQVWQQEATQSFARGEIGPALERYVTHSHVHAFETKAVAKAALVAVWNDSRLANPAQTQIMLAYNRDDVVELNQLARGLRHAQGELGSDALFQTERGERAFAARDRVYFLKNDRSLGVMNGTLGTIESVKDSVLTIRLDQDKAKSKSSDTPCVNLTMERYNQLDHGYAATIHKAQGVTVDRSYVLASRYLDAHSTYVAMSRHRASVDLFYGKDTFLTKEDLMKTLGRHRPKDVTLDYRERDLTPNPQAFAQARGLYQEASKASYGLDKAGETTNRMLTGDERLMRQQTLREFTHTTRVAREAGQLTRKTLETHSLEPHSAADRNSLKSGAIKDSPQHDPSHHPKPDYEKKALAYVDQFKELEKIIEKGGRSSSLAQDHLEKLSDKMSRQKEVMQYVREHHEPLEKQVNQLAKDFQKERGFDLEL